MTRHLIAVFVVSAVLCGTNALAQTPQAPPSPPTAAPGNPVPSSPPPSPRPVLPLKVQVVISRYQGEKKVSSLPYTLTVATNNPPSSIRMGAQVPVVGFSTGRNLPPDAPQGAGPVNYKDIGTNIDCSANMLDDGRFAVHLTINDTSIYADGQGPVSQDGRRQGSAGVAADLAAFRSFSSNQTVILRDGQMTEYTAATDKISGETTKIAVTLTALK